MDGLKKDTSVVTIMPSDLMSLAADRAILNEIKKVMEISEDESIIKAIVELKKDISSKAWANYKQREELEKLQRQLDDVRTLAGLTKKELEND